MQDDNTNKTYKGFYQTSKKVGFSGKYTSFCERMNNLYAINKITRADISPKTDLIRSLSPNRLSFLIYLSIVNNRFLDRLFKA